MRGKRTKISSITPRYFTVGIIAIIFIVFGGTYLLKNTQLAYVFAKIPVINKFVVKDKLSASVYEPNVQTETNIKNTHSKTVNTYKVPTHQDLKIGTFKKVKDTKKSPGGGEVSTDVVTVTEQDDNGNLVTRSAKATIDICTAGTIKGYVYISVPHQSTNMFDKVQIARIQAPLLNLESPFAMMPLVKPNGDKNSYYFLVSSDSLNVISAFHKVTKSMKKNNGKNIKVDKKLFADFLVKLLVAMSRSSSNFNGDKKYTMATILNAFMGGTTSIPFPQGLLSSRVPGELVKNPKDLEDSYRQLVERILGIKKDADNDIYMTPEIKACRELLDTPIDKFVFNLRATQIISGEYRTGKFTPLKGEEKKNFLVPPESDPRRICSKDGDCKLNLVYVGDASLVLFNQINVCYNAIAKYSAKQRIPGQKDAKIRNSVAEDTIYTSGNGIDQEQILKNVLLAIVFDITSQKTMFLGVMQRTLGADVQDPFHKLIKIGLSPVKRILSISESGLFRQAEEATVPYGAIPIPVDCTCNPVSESVIINKFKEKTSGWAQKALAGSIKALSAGLALTGTGVEWNCTYNPGILLLSSTFDTEFSKSSEAVANNSLAEDVKNMTREPLDFTARYNFVQLAKGLGRLNGCDVGEVEEPKANIKELYKANYGKSPIYVQQRVFFDTYPPSVKDGISKKELPPIFQKKQEAVISFPVFSKLSGSFRLNNLIAQVNRAPLGDKESVPDTTFYNVLFCFMKLYTNTSFGHMEFTCKDGSNTAEADFVPDDSICQSLTLEDYKKVAKLLGIEPDAFPVKGKFDSLDGVFKKRSRPKQ